jgi:hypothetical protein
MRPLLGGGDPPIEPEPAPIPETPGGPYGRQACGNCGGAHHAQRCPEIWQALRAPEAVWFEAVAA